MRSKPLYQPCYLVFYQETLDASAYSDKITTCLPQLQEKRLTNAHLAAKRAHILGVLCDLHLLYGLTERRAIAGAVLAHHADLLRAFRLN